ncbi:hypothetical protein MY1884_004080 [Beauveria asiatica]
MHQPRPKQWALDQPREQASKFTHHDILDRYITDLVILHAVAHVSWAYRHFGYPKRPCVPTTSKVG